MKDTSTKLDPKEIELPSTVFCRDIETKVIQMIILQTLSKIEGVGLIDGNLLDSLFGRDVERVKGIFVEQDTKNHRVNVKAEIKVDYGISIPRKAEEVQTKIVEEISSLTGLHVASVHIVIRGLNLPNPLGETSTTPPALLLTKSAFGEEEYNENF